MPQETRWTVVENKSDYAVHLDSVATLFEAAFDRNFPENTWNHHYFENPHGDPIVALAYSGSTLVAHQALIPGKASDGQSDLRYHLSMSTMVHAAHRGMPTFVRMFESVHQRASAQNSKFVLGFPNANLYVPLGRCFKYRTINESPLRDWTPPVVVPSPTIFPDSTFGRSFDGRYGPAFSDDYWGWRTRTNGAQAVVVNDRVRIVYKRLGADVLNVLNVETGKRGATPLDLAGLAAAEGCRSVRITDYHATLFGLARSELLTHENYCVRMSALPLSGPIPDLQFNLLFCDIF